MSMLLWMLWAENISHRCVQQTSDPAHYLAEMMGVLITFIHQHLW